MENYETSTVLKIPTSTSKILFCKMECVAQTCASSENAAVSRAKEETYCEQQKAMTQHGCL